MRLVSLPMLALFFAAIAFIEFSDAYERPTDGAGDLIEFATAEDAIASGWKQEPNTRLSVTNRASVGRSALQVVAEANAQPYRGVELHRAIDLSGAGPKDKLTLHVKQNFGTGMVIQLWTEKGNVNRAFNLKFDEWSQVELDLDLKNWENPHNVTEWSKVPRIQFYANAFDKAGEQLMLDGLSVTVNGKRVGTMGSERMESWQFPQETKSSWRIGNDEAAWAISKSSGQVIGGWNAKTHEEYLLGMEARYHLADRKSLATGLASQDKVVSSKVDTKEQRLDLTCSNAKVPDLVITKRYWLRDNKLFNKVGFTTKSNDLQFITYNCQAIFDQQYRDAGYYMGGGDGGFPLLPAPQLSAWQKVLEYQNTTKGMVLSQPEREYSFAHVRTRLDDQFVWPWFTGAIASYCEAENVMHYTPDGWDISLGTSRLSQDKETSYEQYLSIFKGNWFTFLSQEYPSMPEVREAYAQIPPTPDWVADIKADTFSDIHRLKHLLEMTDEGNIMVLVDFGGSWADYYVDQGLEGGNSGGKISAAEIKDLIVRLKALSPRVKVGIYMWQLSTTADTRIYRQHPEWFRTYGKNGEPLNTFPGLVTNFAQLLSIPECYDALLSQFDLILSYLDTDFIYLDDPKAINPIDWASGEFTRDDLAYRFMLDIKKIAAKHGPDKMVFFNNRGNPYADINYVEARGQMNPEYWRVFAGIATIIEANLTANPKARIVPLYYTTPYQREYINRVLAVGWIPEASSSNVPELLERRAFYQAAYEIGNCAIVPARYNPDWKRDKDTKIESYPMQRNGDKGYLFSFISHQPETADIPVDLDLNTLPTLDKNGQVMIWRYIVENGLEFKGTVTERLARQVYGDTGWQLDHVTRRELIYAGPYQSKLTLNVPMVPLELNQLYITTQASTVYSENDLPANYLFSRMPKINLSEQTNWEKGSLEAQIDSSRDRAELIAFLPQSRYSIDRATLDGQPVSVNFVWEGSDVFPLIAVNKGSHSLSITFSPKDTAGPVAVTDLRIKKKSDTNLLIEVGEYQSALLTVAKGNRVLFNRMVQRNTDGELLIPLASARGDAGSYEVELRGIRDPEGIVRLVSSSPVNVQLPAAPPLNNLPPLGAPVMPGTLEMIEVNREIKGIRVIQAAEVTTDALRGTFQPDMPALMAKADPDNLRLEAGTTSKIEHTTRGAAFAGFEMENVRWVQLKLSNTFYNSFHLFGTGIHTPPWNQSTGNFAGIVVDYHTPAGYTKRVHLATGVRHPECSSVNPTYGKATVADEAYDLGKSLIETPESTFALDLAQYAPADWDGRIWFSVGSDWIASDRRLTAELLAFNDDVTGDILSPTDPKAFLTEYLKPKTITVPKSPGGILIDGVINEEMWREAVKTDRFFLNGGKGVSKANTEALLMYDETQLYVAFTCNEPVRSTPLVLGGSIWDDDEIEIWIDVTGKGKDFRQIIVNGANAKVEFSPSGPTPVGVTSAVHIAEGRFWSVEMTIPYKGLGIDPPKPGKKWRISLCRYRPSGKDFNDEQIVWAPLKADGFRDLENFGTLIFK